MEKGGPFGKARNGAKKLLCFTTVSFIVCPTAGITCSKKRGESCENFSKKDDFHPDCRPDLGGRASFSLLLAAQPHHRSGLSGAGEPVGTSENPPHSPAAVRAVSHPWPRSGRSSPLAVDPAHHRRGHAAAELPLPRPLPERRDGL